ncbi:AMP-binding protein [Plantactinospora sp. B24E8]|uniref:AMP-binding protein n=1 Tax=Plantactinospora sp. B24E8 TaxID=3153567 RepID=UPI00325E8DB0
MGTTAEVRDQDPTSAELAVLAGAPAAYPFGSAVHEVFLRIAARYPDRPALVTGDRSVSYAALAEAGRQAAAGLAAAGVTRGDVVPVLLPRSPDLVAVLLGVLMRGAAYAVFDVRWPDERSAALATVVDARTVVARRPFGDMPTWIPPSDLFARVGADVQVVTVPGDAACCVFFTSGSTGTPKAVLSPHRATTRLFAPGAMNGEFGPTARMPQWAPLPWDGLTLELWSMLLTGGTSALCEDRLPTTGVLRQLVGGGVDSLWLTSSLFNLIVDEDVTAFAGLRRLWTGGERLSPTHVRRFLGAHPGITLVNGYGPAESCVFVTTHEIHRDDCDDPDGIPLGTAVAGTVVVILDSDRVCRVDEGGEICVAGDGLAIGYLGDRELTDRRFVTVAVDGVDLRLYRTGDRGKIGRDGLLRFLGREDRQVKVRGFRVELGDVETLLRAVDGVTSAVVLPDRDPAGSCVGLTGYYTAAAEQTHDPDSVRAALLAQVPRYLVPDRLVAVPHIPVTANGKADHSALRSLAGERTVNEASGPPSDETPDPVLAEVVAVVSAVSGVPCTAATPLDNGTLTSLQAMRVCIRLNERLGVSVPPERVFAASTVRQLAEQLGDGDPDRVVPGPPAAGEEVLLADTQVGFLVEHEMRPDTKAGHCLIGWLVRGPFETQVFRAAMADVQARHEALRACYEADLEPFLTPVDEVPVGFPELGTFTDLADAWAAARADLLRPLALDTGEVWRGNHARFGDQHLVSLVIHHVAYDGWSESVLADDLSTAYTDRLAGRVPAFRTSAPRLAEAIAARQAEATRKASSSVTRDYWARLLRDLPEHRALKGAAELGSLAVAVRSCRLSAETLDGVDRLARELGITRFPVLVAGFAAALADALGQEDFGIGVPVSVRRHATQANVVTCLVDTVCLRLGAPPAGSVRESALRAHQQMTAGRGAYALPFPEVVRAVNPPRQRGRNPLFRTMFVLQDNTTPVLALPAAEVHLHRPAVPEPMSELLVEVWPDETGARLDATFYPEALSADSVLTTFAAYERILARIRPPEPTAT